MAATAAVLAMLSLCAALVRWGVGQRGRASIDGLTALPDRGAFLRRLDGAVAGGVAHSLLHLDLDRFAAINALLGQAAGDAVLVEAARRLRAGLSADDMLARLDGDAFVVLVSAPATTDTAAHLAQELILALAAPFDIDGQAISVGASIGVAAFPADGATADALMHAADVALRRAKRDGRGICRVYAAAMDEEAMLHRRLEQDLHHAIARDELTLHYQPLVSCLTGDVDGFEALLRWNHPTLGLIAPMEFIPIAEASGLILEIGAWVLDQACHAAAAWTEPRWIAVNISPVQFRQADVVALVCGVLARSGLEPDRLELEITEGTLMADTARAMEIVTKLRSLGVRFALDDFGTGYSSLSYLRSFTFDKLKIDRSFIMALGESEDAAVIVRTIITLAHNLGLSITAEGIETAQQLALVRDHLCDEVQGYLLGRPMAMDDFTAEAETRSRTLLLDAAR